MLRACCFRVVVEGSDRCLPSAPGPVRSWESGLGLTQRLGYRAEASGAAMLRSRVCYPLAKGWVRARGEEKPLSPRSKCPAGPRPDAFSLSFTHTELRQTDSRRPLHWCSTLQIYLLYSAPAPLSTILHPPRHYYAHLNLSVRYRHLLFHL